MSDGHVELDNLAGGQYRFAGEKVKECAERLSEESATTEFHAD